MTWSLKSQATAKNQYLAVRCKLRDSKRLKSNMTVSGCRPLKRNNLAMMNRSSTIRVQVTLKMKSTKSKTKKKGNARKKNSENK